MRAITGYQEIILEQRNRLGLNDVVPYLDRVLVSAELLNGLVDKLVDPAGPALEGLGDVEVKLRHDLRTPLNAIIGYSELALEDLEGEGAAATLRGDIGKLLADVAQASRPDRRNRRSQPDAGHCRL